MDTARLKELVKIKDKAKASKADKREFCEGWLQLIREEGPTDEVFEFLVAGFSFCGMEPFAEYLRTAEDRQKAVIAFLRSSAMGKNGSVAFKCALNLLACMLRDMETDHATGAVLIRELPRLSQTKEKQLIKDLGKIFAKQMFSVIYAKGSLPLLDNYELKRKDRNSFEVLVRNGLEQCQELQLSQEEYMGAELAKRWIEPDRTLGIPEPEKKKSRKKPKDESASSDDSAPVVVDEPVVPEAAVPSGQEGGNAEKSMDAFLKMQDEVLKLSAENRCIRAEWEALKAECQKRSEEAERLKAELVEKDEMLFAKEKEAELLENEIGWLKDELAKKERELDDRIQMNQIVQMDSERQTDQELKRLGSELSTYYQDVIESVNVPMSAELGEILRDQILDVFKVLTKHGIRADQ